MPTTRTDPLEHLLLHVLGVEADDKANPYRLAFEAEGITTVDDLFALSGSDLLQLMYKNEDRRDGRT